MAYGITQCYLPPGRIDISAFTQAEAGTPFTDPRGIQCSVDTGTAVRLHIAVAMAIVINTTVCSEIRI